MVTYSTVAIVLVAAVIILFTAIIVTAVVTVRVMKRRQGYFRTPLYNVHADVLLLSVLVVSKNT